MASYADGALVDVRHDPANTWHPGTVTNPCPAHPTGCWVVALDTPVTSDVWTGTTRKRGGSENVTDIHVAQAADINGLTEGELIRTQV